MGTADEQIRVSERIKRTIERHQREGESYNDVLERLLDDEESGDFYDGFGRWDDEKAEQVRNERQKAKEKRKRRMRDRTGNTTT